MSELIRIKKGLDINLKGEADKKVQELVRASSYAIKPTDFNGIMPKMLVQPGDKVKVGSPLFFDKYNPMVKFTSPVSGKLQSVNRGERRRILEVVIEPADYDEFIEFQKGNPLEMSREEIVENLLDSGVWPMIRTRPYSVIANPEKAPKAIFISGFNSAPLAPDLNFIIKDFKQAFQTGIDALSKLTEGKIHLSVNAKEAISETYSSAKRVVLHQVEGPHPAGNVGIQVHHIDPINKGERIWYVQPQDVVSIGNLFLNGRVDNSLIIAVTGSEVLKPSYFQTIRGSIITPFIDKNTTPVDLRYISGNVLTGAEIARSGYVGFYDNQLTVIPEGNKFEFLGWALPGLGKYSVSRSYFSWLTPNKKYRLDTNLKGGRRAFVMTGEYEKVFPMDIYPVQLLKAILIEDIDLMERLGIFEVSEEDMALCEFVCTSKTQVQKIVRQGLDLMRKETE